MGPGAATLGHMLRVEFTSPDDVARLIDGLHAGADQAAGRGEGQLALRYVRLADTIGDALDELPYSSAFVAEVEEIRRRRRRLVASRT